MSIYEKLGVGIFKRLVLLLILMGNGIIIGRFLDRLEKPTEELPAKPSAKPQSGTNRPIAK